MRKGWSAQTLGQLADLKSGGTPRKSRAEYWGGAIPWISGKTLDCERIVTSDRNVTEIGAKEGSQIAPAGSTLILVRGMSLLQEVRIGHCQRPVAFNQDVKALIPREGIDPWFLTYALLARKADLLRMVHTASHGTGVLATEVLQSLSLPIPDADEQRRIAAVLGDLDDLIDTNQRLSAGLYDLIAAETSKALAAATIAAPLSSVAKFVNGKNFTKGAAGEGLPVIRTPEVRNGPTSSTVRNSIQAADDNRALAGDILFVWSGSLLVDRWRWEEGLVNQHIFKVIPADEFPAWLVYSLIQHQMPWFLSLAADKATTMGHIQRKHLDARVPLLRSEEIARLDPILGPMWNQALASSQEAEQLRRVRDELLPLLISGAVSPGEVTVAS